MLGAGIYSSRDSATTLAALRDMAPGCILLFQDGLGLAEQVRAEHPNALIFGRLYCDDWTDWQKERLAEVCLAHPANAFINGWQSENEPDVEDYESAQRVAQRDKAFAETMLAANRWALVVNLAVFKPTIPFHLDYWRNVLTMPNAILNFHGYVYQGSPLEETALRYRLWRDVLGYYMPRIFVGEYGFEPGSHRALGISEDQYVADYTAIAAEWRKDGLIGSACFCLSYNADPRWLPFDILDSGISKRLGDDNRAHPWPRQITAYPKEEAPMIQVPQFRLGFKDLADRLGKGVVGDPTEEETYFDPFHSIQTTTKGLMWYQKGGQPMFLPAVTVPN